MERSRVDGNIKSRIKRYQAFLRTTDYLNRPGNCLIVEAPGSGVNRRRLAENKIFPNFELLKPKKRGFNLCVDLRSLISRLSF
jgi:hypothetical protein